MNSYKLSQSTIEKLEYYVYLLIDPRTNKTFYVGKGHGNRINHHLIGALEENLDEKEKVKTIRSIQSLGLEVGLVILRHGLTEKEAYEIECAMIDFIGVKHLTNLVKGHHSFDKGVMSLSELKIKYEAEEAKIDVSVVLININKKYDRSMSREELYEATRKDWVVKLSNVQKTKYVFAVYRGIIREVYIANQWLPSQEMEGRYVFVGDVAPEIIRQKYIYKSVSAHWKQGSQNPIKYVNI